MIKAENISYQVGTSYLLDDVSAQIQKGRLTAILGPNGAGKSTLLKALSGELGISSGDVTIEETCLSEWNHQYLATRRAVVTQFNQIEFPFTVAEVVMLGLIPAKKVYEVESPEMLAEEYMRELNVMHLADRQYATLSGGEQQRVAIARALLQVAVEAELNNQCILLLDEPTASLDLQYQHDLLRLLKKYSKQNYTIVVILHDINLALQYVDDVILLKNGRVYEAGNVKDVLNESIIEEVFSIQGMMQSIHDGTQRFLVMN